MKNKSQNTLLRKVQLSITAVAFIVWTIILTLMEIGLITSANQTPSYSLSAMATSQLSMQIPFWMHIAIILLIASMVMWLVVNMGELLGLYSKELSAAKKKINEATSDKK